TFRDPTSAHEKATDRTETSFRERGQIMGNIMTWYLAHPQDEQSPQRSTSGYPLQEVVDDKVSGPSAPGVDHSPPGRSLCRKRKKEWSDESEESSEESQKELKRQRVLLVLPEHHEAFNRLLEDPVIKRFLAWDKDLRVSDKYLLAMVIAYFRRAGLRLLAIQRIHFFLASVEWFATSYPSISNALGQPGKWDSSLHLFFHLFVLFTLCIKNRIIAS
ncbi:speedy protein E2B-like, partial [Nomascus leucogenys]|uniref:speedy protein E2B-like n=1 Tax=Nomascus leucogenys TaxID=61853 RepID=UPI00122D6E8F